MRLDVKQAMREIVSKTPQQIQLDEAISWTSRACAAFELASRHVLNDKLKYIIMAQEFAHEALNHAALVEDEGRTVQEVQKQIKQFSSKVKW